MSEHKPAITQPGQGQGATLDPGDAHRAAGCTFGPPNARGVRECTDAFCLERRWDRTTP